MQAQKYDIIVIGAGSGGLNIAGFISKLMLKVLLIDKNEENIGGDCLNTGCVPSKALIHVANQIYEGRLAQRFLHNRENENKLDEEYPKKPLLDMVKITDYIKQKQDIIRETENPTYLKNKGIDFVSGSATFENKNTIKVITNQSEVKLYTAKNIILATGSRPRKLSIADDKSLSIYNNENIFDIDNIPSSFVFIGGGPINCELGQAFARLGSQVTILNTGVRILEKETVHVSEILEKQFESEGIKVINNIKIEKIENKKVYFTNNSSLQNIECDAVFVGIGRELNINNLDLEKGGIVLNENKSKITVDKYLRTSNHKVCAAGDVAGNYQFTHAAEMHAKVIIGNMFSPFKKEFDDKHIAWNTYTSPEISTFGVSLDAAIKDKLLVIEKSFDHDDRAIIDENTSGFISLYLDSKGIVKGGTLVSKNAGEISGELILAMSRGVTLGEIFNRVSPYPAANRIIRSLAAEQESKRLSKGVVRILRILYKIF